MTYSLRTRFTTSGCEQRNSDRPQSQESSSWDFGALDWTRTSIGRSRNPLTIQLVHEHVKQLCNFFLQSGDLYILDDPAGAAPAHDGFADRRVPVSPRVNIGSLSWIRTADIPDQNRALYQLS